MGLKQIGAGIEGCLVRGKVLIQLVAHPRALRSLARKRKQNFGVGLRLCCWTLLPQRFNGLLPITANDGPAIRHGRSSGLQSERSIRKLHLRFRCKLVRQCVGHFVQRRFCFCRQGQHLWQGFRWAFGRRGSLFQNHVNVGATNPKRTHASTPWMVLRIPLRKLINNVKGAVGEVNARVWFAIVQGRRENTVLNGERRFDQAGDSCGCVQVANVGFRRADGAKLFAFGTCAKCFSQCSHFDGIAQRRGRTVRFNVRDGFWIHTGNLMRTANGGGLSADAGRRKTGFVRTIVVDTNTTNYGVNMIAVRQRCLQAFQQHYAATRTEDSSLRVLIKRAAMAIGRNNAAVLVLIATPLRIGDGSAAGQRGITRSAQQTLAGLRDGH